MYFLPVAAQQHVLRTDSHDQTNKDRGSVSISGQLFAYRTLELLALAIVVPSLVEGSALLFMVFSIFSVNDIVQQCPNPAIRVQV